ncbi:hypothetical protein FRB94_004227 [Tulasnella sp. JGI-2019a]|nr:hypothetical protein FRB93_000229 [Tulasnella sp. JGI-2019a]KAG9015108.1 hypothetical protein FRB94_004227 [Tulasnella sp. JGI-2019a]
MGDVLADPDAIAYTQDVSTWEELKENEIVAAPDNEEPRKRESMYVRMFNEILTTVLAEERFLFTDEEFDFLERYKALPYTARYLLVRLILRKPEKWYRSDSLTGAYKQDIPNINVAINALCRTPSDGSGGSCSLARKQPEYITIYDSDDEDMLKGRPCIVPQSESPLILEPTKEAPEATRSIPQHFAQDDTHASLSDILNCLVLPELKALAKDLKVKIVEMKRAGIIDALIQHAEKQTSFSFFKAKENQTSRLRTMTKKITGRCIRINNSIRQLFLRLNLVFFRSTTLTATLLPLILSNTRSDNSSHRRYPKYTATRTNTIFKSREGLLAYERALEQEKQIDDALAGPSRVEGAWKAILILRDAIVRWEELLDEVVDAPTPDSMKPRVGTLERFEEGHVLTRVVYKGAAAYGIVKQWPQEEVILRSLLYQDKWRKGRRGAWYDRLALICMTHKDKSQENFEEAWKIVRTGLDDPHTHLIYIPALEKRMKRIEKRLEMSEEERHQSNLYLKSAKRVKMKGQRIVSLPLSESTPGARAPLVAPAGPSTNKGKGKGVPPVSGRGSIASFCPIPTKSVGSTSKRPGSGEQIPGKDNHDTVAQLHLTGKSVWKGRDGEVSVEQLALEHYEGLGFKGFHAEGRIIVHMFTMLFWPVLFDLSIPGTFETAFQTGPLDLVHDTFYSSRTDAIEERLKMIEDGQGLEFIVEVDERERPQRTWAVGVRWDDFSLDDTLEIAEGIGGVGLSVICRLLCEDYGNRGSGVPDLIVWKAGEKKSMFVEVKGPGDSLRENQKVWIDVMIRSGISVELCLVEDIADKSKSRKKSRVNEVESEDEAEEDFSKLPCDDEGSAQNAAPSPRVTITRSVKRMRSVITDEDPPPSPSRRKTT